MRTESIKILLAVLALATFAERAHGQSASQPTPNALCPRVEVSCPSRFDTETTDIGFSVKLDRAPDAAARLAYDWSASYGRIVNGQGTAAITLDAAGIQAVGTTVTVAVRGLPEGCPATESCTVPGVMACHRPLDEYGDIDAEDEQARLDNLAIELQNDPNAGGHLLCYGGKVGLAGEAQARCERARDYLAKSRGIEWSRLAVEDGGYRENVTVTLWVVPQNAIPPRPSPSVDPSEVTIVNNKPARKRRRR